jgi:hypothetical protein
VGLLEASGNRPGILKTSAAFFLIIAIVFIIGCDVIPFAGHS